MKGSVDNLILFVLLQRLNNVKHAQIKEIFVISVEIRIILLLMDKNVQKLVIQVNIYIIVITILRILWLD